MKTPVLCLLLCALLPALARSEGAPVDLAPIVTEAGFWPSATDAALAKFPKDALVFMPKNQRKLARSKDTQSPASFRGLPVYGPSLDLASNAVLRVSGSMLKSGKQGTLINEDAKNFVKSTLAELDGWAGVKGARVSGQSRAKETKVQHHVWSKAGLAVVFTYALTEEKGKEKGEKDVDKVTAANLAFLPLPAKPGPVDARAILARNRAFGVARPVPPVKNKEGDVSLAGLVPAQFPPDATPAAIAVERVMRSSGIELDTADLQRLDYPPDFPWQRSSDGPLNMIKDAAPSFKVRYNEEILVDGKAFEKIRRDYNVIAKKGGVPVVDDVLKENVLSQIQLMDADTLRTVRGKKDNEVGAFRRLVQKYVGKGLPLLWVMVDGKFGEDPEARLGMETMIITGMNVPKDELIYIRPSDPEETPRRMPLSDAWCLTLRVISITP